MNVLIRLDGSRARPVGNKGAALAIEARTMASCASELLVGIIMIPRPGRLVTIAMADGLLSMKALNLGGKNSSLTFTDCLMKRPSVRHIPKVGV